MKIATILEQQFGAFGLEYDAAPGKKNTMRLDAATYESAIREARVFLGIKSDHYDAEGHLWELD